jgi:CheY-like chemotaxis protein
VQELAGRGGFLNASWTAMPNISRVRKNAPPVLVVEDNESIREDLAMLLTDAGHQVVAVANGLEALEKLRWGLKPCVILLDMRMTVMTGWEFRAEQKLDPEFSTIPVVAMTTGQWKPDDLTDFSDRIEKPIRLDRLWSTLDRYCPRPSASATHRMPGSSARA